MADASDVTGNNKKREEEGGGGGAALRLDCVGSRARQRKSQGRERGEQHGERPRPTDRAAAGTLPGWLVWCSRGPAGDPVGARRTEAELVKKGTSGGGGARVSVALFSGSVSPGGAARFAFASPPRRRGVITLATVTRVAGGRYPGGAPRQRPVCPSSPPAFLCPACPPP